MKPQDYEVDIGPFGDDEGAGFWAVVPELPGCRSDGAMPHEALTNAYDAVVCWIEAAEDLRRAVPRPRRVAA